MIIPQLIPAPYRQLAMVAAIGVFVAGTYLAGLLTGREQVQDKWDADKAIRLQAAFTAEQAARIKEQSLMNQLNEAQNAATERQTKLRADYAAAHAATLGLRDTIAALRGQLSAATHEACRSTAGAALDVFGECSARLGTVAKEADGCFSDRQTLEDAWPK